MKCHNIHTRTQWKKVNYFGYSLSNKQKKYVKKDIHSFDFVILSFFRYYFHIK